jgi:chromosome segregation ATPase
MSQSSNPQVQEFLEKLDEIRAVFVLGRRSFPFLEDTIQFVEDVTVLLEEVNATIQTRSGHMKRATDQLKSVSEATEVATDEILDYTDEVLTKLDVLKDGMKASQEQFEEMAAADEQLLALLREELGEEHDELLEEVEEIEAKKRAVREGWTAQVEESQEALSAIRRKMNQIMMSLQVQDITEQQLTSVNHLIETVRTRIDTLLDDLGTGNVSKADMPSGEPSRTATFNEKARYDTSDEQQQMADDTVADMQNEASPGATDEPDRPASEGQSSQDPAASQSDIDQMFDNQGSSSDAETGGSANGEASQGGEMASQEDIDELFQ